MQGHYKNRFNQNNEEYEGEYYDYEDDGFEDDANDDEEKLEDPKHNKDLLEFLKEREKLKEKFRQKFRKENEQYFGDSFQSQDDERTSTKNSFGSFWGPSQPVISPRVLDLWRSIRESRHVTSKAPGSSSGREGCSSVASSERKVYEALRDMRDYSFLFSDDTDLPDKEPPPPASRHASAPRPLARSAQTPLESNIPRKSLPKAMPSKVPLKSNVVGQVMGTKKLNGKPENIPSTSKHYNPTEKRASQTADRSKASPKQAPTMKSQSPKISPSRDISDARLKKRPAKRRHDEDDGDNAVQMIRNMFGYNPSRYSWMDDDDDNDMEVGFSEIQQEERRSARFARKEDEEQLQLIEQEERRARMRKKQKMNER